MKVKVVVHGHAREFFGDTREQFDYVFRDGETVADMLDALKIIPELVMRVVADGKAVRKNHILVDGETVILLTPVAGG